MADLSRGGDYNLLWQVIICDVPWEGGGREQKEREELVKVSIPGVTAVLQNGR